MPPTNLTPTPPLPTHKQKLSPPLIFLFSILTLFALIAFIAFLPNNNSDNTTNNNPDNTTNNNPDNTTNTNPMTTIAILHTLPLNSGVVSAAFSPDSTRIITASLDNTAKIWNTQTGQPLHTLQHNNEVMSAAFSPDGTRVITTSLEITTSEDDTPSTDGTAKIWKIN